MESKTIALYISFGATLRYLQDALVGYPVHSKGFIIDNIGIFFKFIDLFNLKVTYRASSKLTEFYEKLKKTSKNHVLTVEETEQLKQIMTDIRKTLEAETKGNIAFIVTDKRIDVDKLLWNISGLLPKGVFEKLPDISQYDLIEAGKCIAFERPTAAAFHLLRGTEGVLRKYYLTTKQRGRCRDLSWGPILASLRLIKKNRPPNEILDNLTSIKNNYRNPTQHPEKIYDIEEVQNLFGVCIDAIVRMAKSF